MCSVIDGCLSALAMAAAAVIPTAEGLASEPVAVSPAPALSALPAPVRAMIDAAMADGDAGSVATVIALARRTNPEATAEIDAIEADWRTRLAERRTREAAEKQERLASALMLENWNGKVEFGASRSTGSSNNFGLYGALSGERQGLKWRHKLNARADIQRTNGVTTSERALASWQPNVKVRDRLYAYGLAQYEHDRFLGYRHRYTAGGGIGYGLIASGPVSLEVEGGPAYRFTDLTDGTSSATLAGRASLDFNWKITPTLQLSQTGSVYLEEGDRTATTLTALDTKLLDALKARFSYNIQHERDVLRAVDRTDTLTRATLIYSF
jgi:putative salt-induced outer membrane protein